MARTLREVIATLPAERRAKIAAANRQSLLQKSKNSSQNSLAVGF
jgi:hypothetical protein